jgi:cell wall-associated NlpC family hydrolase
MVVPVLFISDCAVRTEPGNVWNLRDKIVTLTESLTGLPYKYGGNEIDGFDCSGLVHYVFDCYGTPLPRTAEKQAKLKEKIKLRQARPADILVFKLKRRWHAAIYMGDGYFIHAPNRNEVVRKERLNDFWKKRLKSVIRVIHD